MGKSLDLHILIRVEVYKSGPMKQHNFKARLSSSVFLEAEAITDFTP